MGGGSGGKRRDVSRHCGGFCPLRHRVYLISVLTMIWAATLLGYSAGRLGEWARGVGAGAVGGLVGAPARIKAPPGSDGERAEEALAAIYPALWVAVHAGQLLTGALLAVGAIKECARPVLAWLWGAGLSLVLYAVRLFALGLAGSLLSVALALAVEGLGLACMQQAYNFYRQLRDAWWEARTRPRPPAPSVSPRRMLPAPAATVAGPSNA